MPISQDEFENGGLDPGHLIVDFLLSNASKAYTLEELLEHLLSKGIDLAEEDILGVLEELEGRGRIKARKKSGVVYYIYRYMGFRPS
jgi:hypothetical protein